MEKIPTFLHYLPKESVYFKIGFLIKFLFFLSLSIFAIINKNFYINLGLALIILFFIIASGFYKHNKKPVLFVFLAIFLFSLFWLLFSKIGGQVVYLTFPWKTFITENTLIFMLRAISRWSLIAFAGIFFMISTSETELIEALYKIRLNVDAILTVSIAFNTIGFAIKDIDYINYALKSRNYKEKNLIQKIKKMYYIGNVLLLSNIKRVESLTESYYLRS